MYPAEYVQDKKKCHQWNKDSLNKEFTSDPEYEKKTDLFSRAHYFRHTQRQYQLVLELYV